MCVCRGNKDTVDQVVAVLLGFNSFRGGAGWNGYFDCNDISIGCVCVCDTIRVPNKLLTNRSHNLTTR